MYTEIIDLTPAMAAKLLLSNGINRPFSKVTLERYEKAMKRGEWRLNGESIIVFKNGQLGDGQHRCRAVVKTGVTIKTIIVRNADEETFSTINSGKPRNTSDVFSIRGEINTVKLASASRAYFSASLTGRDVYCITMPQRLACLDMHPEIRYWVQRYASSKNGLKFLPSSSCGYFAIASEKHGRELLNLFFEQIANGANLGPKSPALVLRNRLMAQTRSNRISKEIVEAYVIKAINAFVAGKEMTFLRHSQGEDFPKII